MNNLPPQYQLPPSTLAVVAGAAAGVAAVSTSPSRSPSPGPSSVGPIPGAFATHSASPTSPSRPYPPPEVYGTQRKIRINVRGPLEDEYPPVPPPPVPPKTPRDVLSPGPAPRLVPAVSTSPTSPISPISPVSPGRDDFSLRPNLDSRPSSSASSRAAVEEATPGSASPSLAAGRAPMTPRKRRGVKALRSPRVTASPRKRERELRERDRAVSRSTHPTLLSTLSYLLLPLRMLAWPVTAVLSPVSAHFVNAALLLGLLAVIVYLAASKLRLLSGVFPFVADGLIFPVRTLATPTCLLVNLWCPLSLLSEGNSTAQPFWRLFSTGSSVDVAAVSRSLSSEVRVAKDIFDSLLSLGDGRMMEGLAHVRIHELGIAIQTGSTLDERFFIGQELVELADTASLVADEIVRINAMSVSIFSWLFWEFSHIVKLLDLPESSRPSPRILGARLDSLVARLDSDLDRLYSRVGQAIPVAERGAAQGWALHEHLSFIHSDLQAAHEKYPTWQRALEAGKHFFAGGDPSKLTRISRDLDITRGTISGITETRNSLERVRIGLVAFRDQVRHFSASVMGLHLGADEAVGLGPAQELAILSTVVGELGSSVGRAKRLPGDPETPRIDAD